jgi:vacuolar-type H+-ATPase subunit H
MGAALGALGEFAGPLSAIASIISIGGTLYQVLSPPKIEIPRIQIPQADLDRLNRAIEANKALSDQAKVTVQQAIQNYNEGRLIPQYEAMLTEWWKKASTQLQQRLASAGLENSSIAQSAFNELAQQYQSYAGQLLRQQLSDALSLSGLAQQEVQDIMSKIQLETGVQQAYAQSYAQAMGLAQQAQAMRGLTSASLIEAATKLPETLQKLGVTVATPSVTGAVPITPGQYYGTEGGVFERLI